MSVIAYKGEKEKREYVHIRHDDGKIIFTRKHDQASRFISEESAKILLRFRDFKIDNLLFAYV